MTNRKVFASINEESIGENFFMFDNNTLQHSFFQELFTQNMSQYSQSNEK